MIYTIWYNSVELCIFEQTNYMADNGTIKTGVSLPTSLWNKVIECMESEGISTFSYWVQKSSRIHLKLLEERNIKEYVQSLDEKQLLLLRKEIKKRS